MKVPPSGFGYPLGGFDSHISLEVCFNFQRSWASPFRAFLFSGDRECVSAYSSALALSYKSIPALYRCSSDFFPPGSRVLCQSEGLVRTRTSCPFGFLRPFRLLPPPNQIKSIFLLISPSRFFLPDDLTVAGKRNPRGCSLGGLALSLRRGRRPV